MFRMLFFQMRDWKRKPLSWLGLLLGMSFVLAFTLDTVRTAKDAGELINVLEPTIIMGSSAWNTLFLLLGVLLILSDSPFLSDYTPAIVMRLSRKKWFFLQIMYIVSVCIFYYLFLSIFSVLLCLSIGYIENAWSYFLYSISSGNYAYQGYSIEFSNLRFMKEYSPTVAYIITLLSQSIYAITLELIVFLLNTYSRRGYGICIAAFFHVLGYVIFLEGMVGIKKMSLMLHALPALHAQQFYPGISFAPTLLESAIVFVIINAVLVIGLMLMAKRFDFIRKV